MGLNPNIPCGFILFYFLSCEKSLWFSYELTNIIPPFTVVNIHKKTLIIFTLSGFQKIKRYFKISESFRSNSSPRRFLAIIFPSLSNRNVAGMP